MPVKPARRRPRDVDDLDLDQLEVPAAVVCAQCGAADCPGCEHESTRSGVVAIVPWERPGAPFFSRLWTTARASTVEADRFFEMIPDGPIAPAFRFAIACELVGVTAFLLVGAGIAALVAPSFFHHLVVDEAWFLARVLLVGVPGLASLLVAAHAAHGWALDWGARKQVGRSSPSRALRFGLYAAGWDLVLGPLGAVVMAFKEGIGASVRLASTGVGLPSRAARAFLRGAYGLEGARAARPLRASYLAAVIATVVGAGVFLFAAVAMLLV